MVDLSLHPQNSPGVLQSEDEGNDVVVEDMGSLHPPKKPGEWHVVEKLVVKILVDVAVCDPLLLVVVSSLQPNHPGVLHDEVDALVEVRLVLVEIVEVVVSSKQPHHPGVWHVDVRVLVFVEVDDRDEVVLPVPLLSTCFQSEQSLHSGVNLHSGTVSYFLMTSLMTLRIRWVAIPTLHPKSPTTS